MEHYEKSVSIGLSNHLPLDLYANISDYHGNLQLTGVQKVCWNRSNLYIWDSFCFDHNNCFHHEDLIQ